MRISTAKYYRARTAVHEATLVCLHSVPAVIQRLQKPLVQYIHLLMREWHPCWLLVDDLHYGSEIRHIFCFNHIIALTLVSDID